GSYGAVRYRRSLQAPMTDKEITRPGPIPLQQKAKRPANPIATGSTPPGTIALRPPARPSWGGNKTPIPPGLQPPAAQPILLTKRKERRKTLPLALGQTPHQERPSGEHGASSDAKPAPLSPLLTDEIEAGAPVQVIEQSEDTTISLDSDSWGAPIEEADDS